MPEYQHQLKVWNSFYDWCRPHIKNFRNALDIGCDTFGFAKNLETDFGHVHCFDFRDRGRFLSRTVKDPSKFTYHNTGLGEKEDVRYTKSGVGRIKELSSGLKVSITTVDKFDFDDVDFIKCDVEGYETKILQGSLQTIERCSPTIVIEQNRNEYSATELLKSLGYEHVDTWHVKGKPHDFIFVRQ